MFGIHHNLNFIHNNKRPEEVDRHLMEIYEHGSTQASRVQYKMFTMTVIGKRRKLIKFVQLDLKDEEEHKTPNIPNFITVTG